MLGGGVLARVCALISEFGLRFGWDGWLLGASLPVALIYKQAPVEGGSGLFVS
jgi:hypothetical protein